MSKLPVQKLPKNKSLDADVVSCSGPSHFYVQLATMKRDLDRMQDRHDPTDL
jgi:hypothetical protein